MVQYKDLLDDRAQKALVRRCYCPALTTAYWKIPSPPTHQAHGLYWDSVTAQLEMLTSTDQDVGSLTEAEFQYYRSTRLAHLVYRALVGLILYQNCTKEELRTFCKQRRLNASIRHSDWELQCLLEKADESRTFERFSELPRELRDCIYEVHFKSLSPNSDGCIPIVYAPPITKVSKLCRAESESLFYATLMFNLGKPWGPFSCMPYVPKKHLNAIRRFRFTSIRDLGYVSFSQGTSMEWDIDFGAGSNTPRPTVKLDRLRGLRAYDESDFRKVLQPCDDGDDEHSSGEDEEEDESNDEDEDVMMRRQLKRVLAEVEVIEIKVKAWATKIASRPNGKRLEYRDLDDLKVFV